MATDYVGWTVSVPVSMLFKNLGGDLRFPVIAVDDEMGCDFCVDGVAKYEVDASDLGDAGQNTLYCQNCAELAAGGGGAETWIEPQETEYTILVAFGVNGKDRTQAEFRLHRALVPVLRSQDPESPVECWWVAEDARHDGSDNDSAVFVKPGQQAAALEVLRREGLAW